LQHFILEVGKGAEFPKTGKLLGEARVEALHKQDIQKEGQLIVLRLKNIELNSKCAPCYSSCFRYSSHANVHAASARRW
jgi:hypothetical protein